MRRSKFGFKTVEALSWLDILIMADRNTPTISSTFRQEITLHKPVIQTDWRSSPPRKKVAAVLRSVMIPGPTFSVN